MPMTARSTPPSSSTTPPASHRRRSSGSRRHRWHASGSSVAASNSAESRRLRVTTANPCTVAAISASSISRSSRTGVSRAPARNTRPSAASTTALCGFTRRNSDTTLVSQEIHRPVDVRRHAPPQLAARRQVQIRHRRRRQQQLLERRLGRGLQPAPVLDRHPARRPRPHAWSPPAGPRPGTWSASRGRRPARLTLPPSVAVMAGRPIGVCAPPAHRRQLTAFRRRDPWATRRAAAILVLATAEGADPMHLVGTELDDPDHEPIAAEAVASGRGVISVARSAGSSRVRVQAYRGGFSMVLRSSGDICENELETMLLHPTPGDLAMQTGPGRAWDRKLKRQLPVQSGSNPASCSKRLGDNSARVPAETNTIDVRSHENCSLSLLTVSFSQDLRLFRRRRI